MDDLAHGKHLHSLYYLREDGHSLGFVHPSLGLNQVRQSTFLAVFQENIQIIASLLDVNEVHYILMPALLQQVHFSLQGFDELF